MQKHRWLFVFLGVAVLGVVLMFGAAFGAGLTYFFLHADPVQTAFAAPVQVQVHGENNQVGVLISAVETGSAAEAAGLVRGDIILEVNGQAVNSLFDLQSVLAQAVPGDSVNLSVQHGDETRALSAQLGDLNGAAYLGVNTCGGPIGGVQMFGVPQGGMVTTVFTPGAAITEVIRNSPAEAAGLQVGDLILSVDGEMLNPATGLADLIQIHKPGDKVILEIQSEGAAETQKVEVALGENPDNPEQAYLGVGYQWGGPQGMLPFNGQNGMPHFYFHHNGEDSQGQLPPEGWDQNGQFFFHGNPGMGPKAMPPFDLSQLPEGFESAVIISEVITDTPAAQADLQPADLILAADDETVRDAETFVSLMQTHKPGDQVALTVFRAGEELKIMVTLAVHPDDLAKGYLGVMAGTFSIKHIQPPTTPNQDLQELPGVPGGDA